MKPNDRILAHLNANLNKKIADGNPNPITTWLDGTLINASAGSITAEFTVREDQCNHAQVMHGGIIT
ncbi:MAG: hypothetical protein AABZ56_00030, partial [Bacteroidota bacterium]